LEGRVLWQTRKPALLFQAISLYDRALQIDPDYPEAFIGLADAYATLTANQQIDPAVGRSHALAAGKKAVALEPGSAEAHEALGLAYYDQWDWNGADREFRTAIELNPTYGLAYQRRAMVAMVSENFAEAEKLLQKHMEIDPFWLLPSETLEQLYYYWRKPNQLLALAEHTADIFPRDQSNAHFELAEAYAEKGDAARAYQEFLLQRTYRGGGLNDLQTRAAGVWFIALAKGKSEALRDLHDIERRAAAGAFIGKLDLANAAMGADDREKAIHYLREAYQNRIPDLVSARFDPLFDPLHSDPRFQRIFRDMGLGEFPVRPPG
jgi:tetratricopeptide (TPR) repeat protein